MAPAPSLTRRPSFASHRRGESSYSGSSASVSLKGKSSVSRLSPLAKQQAAVLAAANAVSRRSMSRSSSMTKVSLAPTPEPSAVVDVQLEYQEETIAHMHLMEAQTMASTHLMDAQPELRWFMRPYLVDFIIEIHASFRLRQETLYLAMNIVDRYVSKRIVYKRHYQLVGCAALLIAAKFEDSKDHVPTIQELFLMCCKTYEESAFTQMEGHVLSTIEWSLGFPTPEAWLRMAYAEQQESRQTQAVARFLTESTLYHRDFITIAPSMIAEGALLLARHICGKESASASPQATSTATLIDSHIAGNLDSLSAILVQKYETSLYMTASITVRDWYINASREEATSTPSRARSSSLLPAQCISPSSDGSCSDYEYNFSSSRPATPSSMTSTPSRCAHDDDDDMPPTPLSLYPSEDPMAVSLSIGESETVHGKENKMAASFGLPGMASKPLLTHKQPISINAVAAAVASAKIGDTDVATQQLMHPQGARTALGTAQWDCNMQA